MPTILLLIVSNIFMTIAWYWHLKGGMSKPLLLVITISWGIALIEYFFAVPANRIGYQHGWSAAQLKITQEVISLAVFAVFALFWLQEPLNWRYFLAFALMIGAVAFGFHGALTLSLNSLRLSLPVAVFGRASTNSMSRGYL